MNFLFRSSKRSSKKSISIPIGIIITFSAAIAIPLIGLKLLMRSPASQSSQPVMVTKPVKVAALGHIEPISGVVKVEVPTHARLEQLLVKEGDWVTKDQIMGYLGSYQDRQSELGKAKQRLQAAQWQLGTGTRSSAAQLQERALDSELTPLEQNHAIAQSSAIQSDPTQTQTNSEVDAAKQALQMAQAHLDSTIISAPQAGQVLQILTKQGKSIREDRRSKGSTIEIADTRTMQVIAKVNEPDIRLVQLGQISKIISRDRTFNRELWGQVIEIGRSEVKIKLADSQPVTKLTHLPVDVQIQIQPSTPPSNPSLN